MVRRLARCFPAGHCSGPDAGPPEQRWPELSRCWRPGRRRSPVHPQYLGQFALWLTPELDEIVDQMQILLSSANTVVVAAALAWAPCGHYAVYAQRFRIPGVLERRWRAEATCC
ncbi:MAG: hypothetical protein ACLTYN_02315 [Dysosmobacter welbionis]